MFEDPPKTKKYLKVALFGDGGSGKTLFALSFPKPAIIDGEKGSDPYIGRRQFKLLRANRWRQLQAPIDWLKKHPGVFETLIIDPMTIFYQDLIQDIVDYIKNKRGNEIMSTGDWGVEKRRYAAFLNCLIELPMHIVLCFREKSEYEEVTNRQGEEVRKKTGNFLLDSDRQTRYLFDLSFRCYTEAGTGKKKEGEVKFKVQVDKTRYAEWMPLYSVHDITGKLAFETLFEKHVGAMLDAPDAAPSTLPDEPFVITEDPVKPTKDVDEKKAQAARDHASLNDTRTGDDRLVELMEKFVGPAPKYEDFPFATPADLKVLFTCAGDLTWPDNDAKCRRQGCSTTGHRHAEFSGDDGKVLLQHHFGVESAKELRKPHVDFLYKAFGKVLAGLAYLDRDPKGVPFVAFGEGISDQQVKADVEHGGWGK